MNLLRIAKVNNEPGFPLRAATMYKWRHLGKFPELFVQLGGAVYVDLDEFEKLIHAGRRKRAGEMIKRRRQNEHDNDSR